MKVEKRHLGKRARHSNLSMWTPTAADVTDDPVCFIIGSSLFAVQYKTARCSLSFSQKLFQALLAICTPSPALSYLFNSIESRSTSTIMSACDCDRKDTNGGTCDSSCKEESFGIMENISRPLSFAPVLAGSKAAVAAEVVVSFEGCAEHA